MKTEISRILFYAAAIIAAAACSKENETPVGPMPTDGRITITTGISARSPQIDENTGAGNFTDGDIIYLNITGSTTGKTTGKEYTVGKTELKWSDIKTDGKDAEVVFSSCYPVPGSIEDGKFTFDILDAEYSDLLLAKGVRAETGKETIVALNFRHAMHKLVIKYTSESGDLTEENLNNIVTKCNALATCNVDLKESNITDSGSGQLSDYPEVKGKEVSVLVVPQHKDNVTLTVSINGTDKTIKLPDNTNEGPLTELESGRQITVTFDISDEKITVGNMVIGPWDQQGSIEGEIIL